MPRATALEVVDSNDKYFAIPVIYEAADTSSVELFYSSGPPSLHDAVKGISWNKKNVEPWLKNKYWPQLNKDEFTNVTKFWLMSLMKGNNDQLLRSNAILASQLRTSELDEYMFKDFLVNKKITECPEWLTDTYQMMVDRFSDETIAKVDAQIINGEIVESERFRYGIKFESLFVDSVDPENQALLNRWKIWFEKSGKTVEAQSIISFIALYFYRLIRQLPENISKNINNNVLGKWSVLYNQPDYDIPQFPIIPPIHLLNLKKSLRPGITELCSILVPVAGLMINGGLLTDNQGILRFCMTLIYQFYGMAPINAAISTVEKSRGALTELMIARFAVKHDILQESVFRIIKLIELRKKDPFIDYAKAITPNCLTDLGHARNRWFVGFLNQQLTGCVVPVTGEIPLTGPFSAPQQKAEPLIRASTVSLGLQFVEEIGLPALQLHAGHTTVNPRIRGMLDDLNVANAGGGSIQNVGIPQTVPRATEENPYYQDYLASLNK